MEIVEAIALISINGTLIIQLLSFLIFLYLINRIMIRPLHQVILERRALMDRLGMDVVAARQRYQELNRQMTAQEEHTRQSAHVIREEIEAAGKKAAGALLVQTRTELEAIRRKTQLDTAEKLAEARLTLHAEAASIADRMVDSLLSRRVGS